MKKDLPYQKVNIFRWENNQKKELSDLVIRESRLKLILNNKKLISLLYNGEDADYLGIGFLYSSGFLKEKEDIYSVVVNEEEEAIEIKAKNMENIPPLSEGFTPPNLVPQIIGRGTFPVEYKIIFKLMNDLQEKAELFQLTGGTHSCALADMAGSIILFTEDISRYNTVDKILGEAFIKQISLEDKIILTSCRITSGIFTKIAVGKVPIIVSRAAPTDKTVQLAQKTGITLMGFVRGERMNIYSYPERIKF